MCEEGGLMLEMSERGRLSDADLRVIRVAHVCLLSPDALAEFTGRIGVHLDRVETLMATGRSFDEAWKEARV